jgi:hypothetical protein
MKIDTAISTVSFVYPFTFDGESFESCTEQVKAAEWQGRKRPLSIWVNQNFPDSDLLPHIANYLNPPASKLATARTWRLTNEVLSSPTAGLGGGAGQSSTRWYLVTPYGEIAFCIHDVQLILFKIGVGLLSVHAAPIEKVTDVDQWLDFTHFFRFYRGRSDVHLRAEKRIGLDPDSKQPIYEAFFPAPAGGLEQHPDGSGLLDDLIQAILQTVALRNDEQWWRDAFVPGTMLPYAVFYMDGVPEEKRQLMRYRVRKFFHSRQEIHPAEEEFHPQQRNVLEYTDNQWFTFSLDGGAYIAFDAPQTSFFRQVMPDHLRKQYYFLFLLTLHQRFALTMLSEQVAEQWLEELDSAQLFLQDQELAFAKIHDSLLTFTAFGHFVQVVQRENPHRCYQRWQQTFQLAELYQEVKDEIDYMYDDLVTKRSVQQRLLQEAQQQQSKRLEQRLNNIAWLIGTVALALGFIEAIQSTNVITVVIVGVLSSIVGLIFIWLLNR